MLCYRLTVNCYLLLKDALRAASINGRRRRSFDNK
jgi:hypothetical protein